jgi:hypothetical protein
MESGKAAPGLLTSRQWPITGNRLKAAENPGLRQGLECLASAHQSKVWIGSGEGSCALLQVTSGAQNSGRCEVTPI